MKMYPMVASAALAGFMATGAAAGTFSKAGPGMQEPVVSTPMAPPAPARFNWTGGYAGAGLGYGRMSFSGDNGNDGDDVTAMDNDNGFGDRSSAAGGLFAGYRQDLGNFVVGGEAIISPATFGTLTLPGESGDEIKGGAALLFTAGVPITADARTLAYAGVGPAMLRTSGDNGSENSFGGTGAIGIDHMLTDSIMLRGSVNYTVINNVGNDDVNTRTLGAGVGVGFKF